MVIGNGGWIRTNDPSFPSALLLSYTVLRTIR